MIKRAWEKEEDEEKAKEEEEKERAKEKEEKKEVKWSRVWM